MTTHKRMPDRLEQWRDHAAPPEYVNEMLDSRKQLRAERDRLHAANAELVEALQNVLPYVPERNIRHPVGFAKNLARATLAKYEGGAS